jgi:hypothetical protein
VRPEASHSSRRRCSQRGSSSVRAAGNTMPRFARRTFPGPLHDDDRATARKRAGDAIERISWMVDVMEGREGDDRIDFWEVRGARTRPAGGGCSGARESMPIASSPSARSIGTKPPSGRNPCRPRAQVAKGSGRESAAIAWLASVRRGSSPCPRTAQTGGRHRTRDLDALDAPTRCHPQRPLIKRGRLSSTERLNAR